MVEISSEKKKRDILIPAIAISRGYRTIEIPKEVLKKWLSMQKSLSKEKIRILKKAISHS